MIDNEFGGTVKTDLKQYAEHNRKLSCMEVRKEFLLKCRRNGIFPSHIQNSFKCLFDLMEERSPYLQKLESCVSRFKKTILNLEIKHTYYKLKVYKSRCEELRETIQAHLPSSVYRSFLDSQNGFYLRSVGKGRSSTNKKYQALLDKSTIGVKNSQPSVNSRALCNATTTTIPKETEMLLSLGPKFALPFGNPAEIPFYHVIADVEDVIKTHSDTEVQERTRCAIANTIQNFLHNSHEQTHWSHPQAKLYKEAEKQTRMFFKQNPGILVLQADKGNKTVLMEKEEYITKMKMLVEDEHTYEKMAKDPTSNFQTKNNNIIKRLENLGILDHTTAAKMRTYKAVCPKIYGQPKAHKPGLPLRPVVPCMTSPAYQLSKYVANILQMSKTSKYNIRNSFEFCEYVNNVKLPDGHVLVSFDVVSLFTCIPKELVRKSVFKHWTQIEENTSICLDIFWEITDFCIDCSFFTFQGVYYKQKFGTAMGNPLSPIIADMVLEDLLEDGITKLDFPIPCLKKYVDDLFLSLPRDQIETVKNVFNGINPHLQFTTEEEVNNRLPFLDMMLVRKEDQTVKTEWYIKPIASGRFLNYHSCHPMHQKMNVASNFAQRVKNLSTNWDQNKIGQVIHHHLKLNDYPKTLINRVINHTRSVTKNGTAMEESGQMENKIYRSLTNVFGLTQRLTKTLRRDYPQVKIANKNQKTVGALIPPIKDKTAEEEQSNVIYQIHCNDCEGSYIGMTTTKLKNRISGHRSNLKKLTTLREAGYTNEDAAIICIREKTALVDHAAKTGHTFKLDNAKIVDRSFKTSNLPILESCHIKNTQHTVNKRTDTDNLHAAYANVLHMIQKNNTKRQNQNKSNENTQSIPSTGPVER